MPLNNFLTDRLKTDDPQDVKNQYEKLLIYKELPWAIEFRPIYERFMSKTDISYDLDF